jgi:hypothetical protein
LFNPLSPTGNCHEQTLLDLLKARCQDDDDDEEDREVEEGHRYAFPELDARVRQVIKEYGAVFPKLNFSSPKVCTFLVYYFNR